MEMGFLDKDFWQGLNDELAGKYNAIQDIRKKATDAQRLAKTAINDLQRGDFPKAEEKLMQARGIFMALEQAHGHAGSLRGEGAWRAGVEEFVEAILFHAFCTGQEEVTGEDEFYISEEEFLGGLSDITGEIVRYMRDRAIAGEYDKLLPAKEVIDDIFEVLTPNNFTKQLRSKFDQARRSHSNATELVLKFMENK